MRRSVPEPMTASKEPSPSMSAPSMEEMPLGMLIDSSLVSVVPLVLNIIKESPSTTILTSNEPLRSTS